MKLLFIFGDQAVGKMTVGQELAKITDLRLFHNHMTIDIVTEIFGSFRYSVIERLREVIFEEFAASEHYGLIFTFMLPFGEQRWIDYIEHVSEIFRRNSGEIYYAELHAPKEVRLQRNITENRLAHKPSKRNTEELARFIEESTYRCVSEDGEVPFENYIKIDNTDVPAADAARMIKERFLL